MSKRMFRQRAIAVAIGAALAMAGGSAVAAGFQLQEQNASGLGNAYAGQAASAQDASTIWFNPAGMTLVGGRQVVGSVEAIKTSVKFSNSGLSTTPGPAPTISLLGNDGDAGGWGFLPNAYLSWEVMANTLWLGVGVNTPFGLKTEWDAPWVGQFHALNSDVKTVNINPSIGWKVNQWLSLGAGINALYLDAKLSNAVFTGTPVVPIATVKANDWGWGWNIGAMFTITPDTRIGVTYRSKIDNKLEGDVTFNLVPFLNGGVKADIKLPDTFSIALSQQIGPRWQILADYTWTGWDSIQALTIFRSNGLGLSSTPLNFKNSWRIGVGANYQLTPEWKLRGGLAYDTTPVQDEFRTPRLPDQDRTWLAIGAQWAMSKTVAFDTGLAYLFIKDASSNLPNFTPQPVGFPPSFRGALSGNYSANTWILGAQVRFNF